MHLPSLIGCRTHLLQFGQAPGERRFDACPPLGLTLDQGGTLGRVHRLIWIESETRFEGLAPANNGGSCESVRTHRPR